MRLLYLWLVFLREEALRCLVTGSQLQLLAIEVEARLGHVKVCHRFGELLVLIHLFLGVVVIIRILLAEAMPEG